MFGEDMKRLRVQRNLSQTALAKKSGISTSTICGIEKGKVPNPRVNTMASIARALGIHSEAQLQERPMNNLTVLRHNGISVVDSREVAEMLGKSHGHLMRDIQGYSDILTESNFGLSEFFIPGTYQDRTGRTLPCYLLTRKGCEMVAHKMTGEKGVLFTAMYVSKFEEMEKALAAPKEIVSEKPQAETLHLNTRTRQAEILKDMALAFQSQLSSETVQALLSGVTELVLGKPLLTANPGAENIPMSTPTAPRPSTDKTYAAKEIAKETGIDAKIVGRIASAHGLKTEEYGVVVLYNAPYGDKKIPGFRYNEKGRAKLLEILHNLYAPKN